MRIDQLLGERGLASTRSQAQRLIAAGVQWRLDGGAPWKRVAKNGDDVPDDAELELLDTSEARYVSRGGLKLEGALKAAGLEVTGSALPGRRAVHRRLSPTACCSTVLPSWSAWTWARPVAPEPARRCAGDLR